MRLLSLRALHTPKSRLGEIDVGLVQFSFQYPCNYSYSVVSLVGSPDFDLQMVKALRRMIEN